MITCLETFIKWHKLHGAERWMRPQCAVWRAACTIWDCNDCWVHVAVNKFLIYTTYIIHANMKIMCQNIIESITKTKTTSRFFIGAGIVPWCAINFRILVWYPIQLMLSNIYWFRAQIPVRARASRMYGQLHCPPINCAVSLQIQTELCLLPNKFMLVTVKLMLFMFIWETVVWKLLPFRISLFLFYFILWISVRS